MKMTRRVFCKKIALASVPMSFSFSASPNESTASKLVRLGGPISRDDYDSPESWIAALQKREYRAAYCPLDEDADDATVRAYRDAARKADVVISEVGAWSNPISPLEDVRKEAIEKCIRKLDLADRIGARCCVNVSGSRGTESIGGPHPLNLTRETFDMIVEVTRKIIDSVKPTSTYFTLETMPWAYPNSVDNYLDLLQAIDRKACAAHFDPVNLINSPSRYFNNAAVIREGFRKLGKTIRSCHAKDTLLSPELTTHLDEVVPGTGKLDYAVYLEEIAKLDDVPLMMEHIKPEEYPIAAQYIRKVGAENGLIF